MRDETRNNLNAHQTRGRRAIIAVGGILILLAPLSYIAGSVPNEPSQQAFGTLRNRQMLTDLGTQERTIVLEVLLDDGRYAMAEATFRQWPAIGSRVVLREEINWFGFHHYYWDGLTPETAKTTP